jgi:endonuclease/exonuclease/phosphatase (EEP) superfamily protein YafD
MKKIFLILIIIFSIKSYSKSNLNVMVWNIWHGGKSKELPVSDARPEIAKIIKKANADVVIMIETYGSAKYFSESLGYDYKLLSNNLCIFSKYKIVRQIPIAKHISSFNFGGVELEIEKGKNLMVFDTWLHYLPDTRLVPTSKSHDDILAWENKGSRDDEIKNILECINQYCENSDSIPIIMGGDFNSHSHLDWTNKTKDMYNHGGAVVNWTVSSLMTAYGFKDSFREYNPNPENILGPTNIGGHRIDSLGVDHYELFRRDRIDYIYYQGDKLKVKNSHSCVSQLGTSFIYKGESYLYPSDHGFVVTEFEYE